jgi:hypothetical protein
MRVRPSVSCARCWRTQSGAPIGAQNHGSFIGPRDSACWPCMSGVGEVEAGEEGDGR